MPCFFSQWCDLHFGKARTVLSNELDDTTADNDESRLALEAAVSVDELLMVCDSSDTPDVISSIAFWNPKYRKIFTSEILSTRNGAILNRMWNILLISSSF